MDKRLLQAERIREQLKCAPPAKCARLTEKLVRLLDEIAE